MAPAMPVMFKLEVEVWHPCVLGIGIWDDSTLVDTLFSPLKNRDTFEKKILGCVGAKLKQWKRAPQTVGMLHGVMLPSLSAICPLILPGIFYLFPGYDRREFLSPEHI